MERKPVTEFIGCTVPVGWRKALTKLGDGNRSLAICRAIAAHYGWKCYSPAAVRERRKPVYVVDVYCDLPMAQIRRMLLAMTDPSVKPRTVERAKVSTQIHVLVVNQTTGATSKTPVGKTGRDRRVIKDVERKIIAAIKAKQGR